MKCCFKFGGIIQCWHCILVLTLQICVLTRGVFRYISVRTQIFDARHGLDWDTVPLHFYVNCIVFASAFTLVMAFLLCANRDHLTPGAVFLNSSELFPNSILIDDPSNRSNSLSPARKKRSYNLQRNQSTKFPLAFLFHVLAAYFLLLPIPWCLGEQAKNEAINPNLVWQTDLSFIFPILSPKDVMRNTRIRYPDLASRLASSDLFPTRLKGTDLLAVQPPILGGIGQLPQTRRQESAVEDLKSAILHHSTGVKTTHNEYVPGLDDASQRPPSLEFINCFLSLAFLAIRIAINFWRVWPTFSYLASILLIVTAIYLVVEYAAVSLLVQLTACLTTNSNSSGIYGTLLMVRLPMRLTSWQMILLSAIGFVVNLSSYVILFHLGVRHFYKAIQKNYYTVANVLRLTKGNSNGTYGVQRPSTICSEIPSFNEKEGCCDCRRRPLYNRTLIIFGFLSLIVNIIIRLPCLCDIFLLYWNERDYLCLTVVVLFVCVNLAWLMIWFGFAMKQRWNFRLSYQGTVPQCMDPGTQSQFLSDPPIQGHLNYSPISECDEEASFPLRNQTFFSPLQLQNPDVSFQTPICLPSTQIHPNSNSSRYSFRIPISNEIMTNKFYETHQPKSETETPSMAGRYFLAPIGQKFASIRRLNQWDAEPPNENKQNVLINVSATCPPGQTDRGPRTISCETARTNDTRPQSVVLQPIDGESTPLRVAAITTRESSRSTASSADHICSRV
nr:hypothetical protein HmN_000017300 [Hymenolepis microstoma]